MSEQKTAAELAAEVRRDFETKHDSVKEIAEKALAEAEKGAPLELIGREVREPGLQVVLCDRSRAGRRGRNRQPQKRGDNGNGGSGSEQAVTDAHLPPGQTPTIAGLRRRPRFG